MRTYKESVQTYFCTRGLDMHMNSGLFLYSFTFPATAETMYNSQQQLSTLRSQSRRLVLLTCFVFDRLCSFNERMEQIASVYLYVINIRKITIKTLYLVCLFVFSCIMGTTVRAIAQEFVGPASEGSLQCGAAGRRREDSSSPHPSSPPSLATVLVLP